MASSVFDFITRQQVYLEGVKNFQAKDANRYLKLIADNVSSILRKLGVQTLGELSVAQLRKLITTVVKAANKALENFGTQFLLDVKQISFIDTRIQKAAWAIMTPDIDLTRITGSSVWTAAKNRIVPAFGRTLKDQIVNFAALTKDKLRTRINTGFANNDTVSDVERDIVAMEPGSMMKGVASNLYGIIHTALQHVTTTVTEVIGREVYDCYEWCSIIDSRTSDICKERNRTVYRYGEGPQPPAHGYCRSRTVPCPCGEGIGSVPSYQKWLTTQPDAFLRDVFGASTADKIKSGDFDAIDAVHLLKSYTLSTGEFELKAKLITA